MKKINKNHCCVLILSVLIIAVVFAVLYLIMDIIDVPVGSPLADPNYMIKQLDPAVEDGINELHGGKNYIGDLIFLALAGLVVLFYVVAYLRDTQADDTFAPYTVWLLAICSANRIATAFYSTFFFGERLLRAGAQDMLNTSHRLRVIIAYLMMANKYHLKARTFASFLVAVLITVSCLLARLIVWFVTKKRQKKQIFD